MLIKLSLKNARKTLNDYAIYILTVSIIITLTFMMNRLMFSPEIKALSGDSPGMQMLFFLSSAVMLVVNHMLIKYMTRFILNQRSKEFGLYQLMGLEAKQIKIFYWIEQCYLGGISILIGIPTGLLFGEILRSILFHHIGCIHYSFTFIGLGASILLTIGESIFIYLIVRVTSRKLFHNRTILSWIQANRKNEVIKPNSPVRYILAGVCLAICITDVCILKGCLRSGNQISIVLCFGSLFVSTCGLATSLIRLFHFFLLRNNNQFTMHILPARFVAKRIASKSFQVGVLSIIFLGSIVLLSIGFILGNYLKEFGKEYNGFDFYYTPKSEDGVTTDFISGMENILIKYGVKDKVLITGFSSSDSELYTILNRDTDYNRFISLSTYNHIRNMLGKEPVTLNENEFIIQSHIQLREVTYLFPIREYQILNRTMKLKSVETEPLNTICVGGGDAYYVVVPDSMLEGLPLSSCYHSYAYQLSDSADYSQLESDLLSYVEAHSDGMKHVLLDHPSNNLAVSTNGHYLSDYFCLTKTYLQINATGFGSISVAVLFLGIVFTLVLSTILAVLLSSEVTENQQRFLTLHRLGTEERDQKHVLFLQIISLFSVPVMVGLPLTVAVCIVVGSFFAMSISIKFIVLNMGLTIIAFLLIYTIYMFVTYQSLCKKII